MKHFLIFTALVFFGFVYSQSSKENMLLGIWKLDGYVSANGEVLPSSNININTVVEFKENNICIIRYSPDTYEELRWSYDQKNNSIVFKTKVDPSTFGGRYLIKNEIAKLIDNAYWDEFSDKIISIDSEKLVTEELKNRHKVYKKIYLLEGESLNKSIWTDNEISNNIKNEINKKAVLSTIKIITIGNDKKTYRVNEDGTEDLIKEEKIFETKKEVAP